MSTVVKTPKRMPCSNCVITVLFCRLELSKVRSQNLCVKLLPPALILPLEQDRTQKWWIIVNLKLCPDHTHFKRFLEIFYVSWWFGGHSFKDTALKNSFCYSSSLLFFPVKAWIEASREMFLKTWDLELHTCKSRLFFFFISFKSKLLRKLLEESRVSRVNAFAITSFTGHLQDIITGRDCWIKMTSISPHTFFTRELALSTTKNFFTL